MDGEAKFWDCKIKKNLNYQTQKFAWLDILYKYYVHIFKVSAYYRKQEL